MESSLNAVPVALWPLLARLGEEVPTGIMLLDAEGRIVWENRAGRVLLGLPPDAPSPVIGEKIDELPNVRAAGAGSVFRSVLAGQPIHDLLVDIVSIAGVPVSFRVDGGPVYEPGGALQGAWFWVRDAVRFNAQAGRLLAVQRMEILGLSVTGVIHDLNNILTALGGTLELLRGGQETSAELVVALDGMVRRSQDITTRLLEVARPGNQEFEPLDLRTPLRQAVDLMRHGLGPGIRLDSQVPSCQVPALCSRTALLQVLFNLGTNARDAMRGRGQVLITLDVVEDPAFSQAQGWALPRHALLRVQDSGPGVPPDQAARIFEPFFTTKGGEGTGMGLAVVKRGVLDHGGTIEVSEGSLGGASFAVRLPIFPGPVDDDEPTRRMTVPLQFGKTGPPLSGLSLLLADDEATLRLVLSRGLSRAGASVRACEQGGDALTALEESLASREAFDAAIIDMHMPGIDGVELITALRKLAPDLHIIATSGLEPEPTTMEALTQLSARFLPKPFRLTHAVEAVLAR